jgi:hypothetical protein
MLLKVSIPLLKINLFIQTGLRDTQKSTGRQVVRDSDK